MIDAWLTLIGATFGALLPIAKIGATFGALLPIANPFSTAPVFASLSSRMGNSRRNQQARMSCIYMASVLLVSLVAGAMILEFFGISMPALRIAGGLIVAKVGFSMLSPVREAQVADEDEKEGQEKSEIAFTPIAMPLLSGPGSIAVTISMATTVDTTPGYVAVGAGILLVSIVSWLVLRSSTRIIDYLGHTGVDVLTRLMGLVLVGIGIQFIVTGLFELVTSEAIVAAIREAYSS